MKRYDITVMGGDWPCINDEEDPDGEWMRADEVLPHVKMLEERAQRYVHERNEVMNKNAWQAQRIAVLEARLADARAEGLEAAAEMAERRAKLYDAEFGDGPGSDLIWGLVVDIARADQSRTTEVEKRPTDGR
jgi:hypothetical protein